MTYSRIDEFKFVSEGRIGARPLVLVPGFGHDPHQYSDYLEALDRSFERIGEPHEQFALCMRRYHELVRWPHSINGWSRIIEDFIQAAELREQNDGLEPIVIGHSMGAAAAWRHAQQHGGPLAMVAPLVPTTYSMLNYLAGGVRMNLSLARGEAGEEGKLYARMMRVGYAKRFIASPINRLLLIRDASNYRFPDGLTSNPTLIIIAKNDAFFKDMPSVKELPGHFSDANVLEVPDGRHDLPMIDPEWLTANIAPWIIEQEEKQRKNKKRKRELAA